MDRSEGERWTAQRAKTSPSRREAARREQAKRDNKAQRSGESGGFPRSLSISAKKRLDPAQTLAEWWNLCICKVLTLTNPP